MIIVEIAGRMGKDAETRFTPSGQKVTSLTVATNVRKGGKEETVWWRVTIWGERFDKLMPYLKKGSAIIVVGEMGKPDIWTDKEGRPQVSLELTAEIIRFNPFGGGEKSSQEQAGNQSQQNHTQYNAYNSGGGSVAEYGATAHGSLSESQSYQSEEPIPF
jgi:single-strand DNA-binding protein